MNKRGEDFFSITITKPISSANDREYRDNIETIEAMYDAINKGLTLKDPELLKLFWKFIMGE